MKLQILINQILKKSNLEKQLMNLQKLKIFLKVFQNAKLILCFQKITQNQLKKYWEFLEE